MAGDDDLKLNTLHRFAKQSPRLVLHEYSHCEVPAGCGGVVLRWIDPVAGAPCVIQLRGEKARCAVWLDGVEIASGLSLIRAGRRVLGICVERTAPGEQPFFVSVHPDGESQADHLSTGQPRWCATTTEPPPTWTAPDFDDSTWPPPVDAEAAVIEPLEDWRRRIYTTAREAGQRVFVIDRDRLWLRVEFTFTPAPRGR